MKPNFTSSSTYKLTIFFAVFIALNMAYIEQSYGQTGNFSTLNMGTSGIINLGTPVSTYIPPANAYYNVYPQTIRSNSNAIIFATNSLDVLRINPDGRIGIGTASTGLAKLALRGQGNANKDFVVNGRMQTGDAANAGGLWVGTDDKTFVGRNGANIGFWTIGAWRFTIGDDGWGQFTNNLDVGGQFGVQGGAYVDDNLSVGDNLSIGGTFNVGGKANFGGNVGIGIPTPSAKLHVLGNKMILQDTSRATYSVYNNAGGNIGYSIKTDVGGGWAWQLVVGGSTPTIYMNVD